MYKMLVMDMDGTLLKKDKTISQRNREALMEASKKGVKIVVCTGRIFASAVLYGEMIGVKTPIIASNGAYIREKDRDEVIYAALLGKNNTCEIVNLSHKYNLYCHVFTWDTIFSERIIYTTLNYTKWNDGLPEEKKVKIKVIDKEDWESIIEDNKGSILKAVIVSEDPVSLSLLRNDISKLDVEIVSSFPNNIEVMNRGVSKGNAAEKLARYYGISRNEVICIGDSENDISMIEYAGLGIAMENGTEDTKKAADFITASNEDDGVAYVIEKFVLST